MLNHISKDIFHNQKHNILKEKLPLDKSHISKE